MQFVPRDIVNRARLYLDDDHNETQGWISDQRWLDLFNVEMRFLWRKWTRLGLVRPVPVDEFIPSAQFQIVIPTPFDVSQGNQGVLAVVGVAEDMGSYMRYLAAAQPTRGAYPYWVAAAEVNQGKAISWAAYGPADSLTVELSPRDPATGTNYKVRWIPTIAPMSSLDSTTVDLPFGTDERLVLGIARRAAMKDHSSSALMEKMIVEADAEIQFTAHGKLDNQSPRVRRVRPDFHRRRWPQLSTSEFPTDPNYWLYP